MLLTGGSRAGTGHRTHGKHRGAERAPPSHRRRRRPGPDAKGSAHPSFHRPLSPKKAGRAQRRLGAPRSGFRFGMIVLVTMRGKASGGSGRHHIYYRFRILEDVLNWLKENRKPSFIVFTGSQKENSLSSKRDQDSTWAFPNATEMTS